MYDWDCFLAEAAEQLLLQQLAAAQKVKLLLLLQSLWGCPCWL